MDRIQRVVSSVIERNFPKQLTENLDDRNFYRYLILSVVCAFTDIFQDIQHINVENVQMRERERERDRNSFATKWKP